mmetsp:Transcript_44749/g.80190  ORF Transcript_44749/g.80190 Transcript_44749/m.80190 type:complete len:122 (-) Transcript_44749:2954-3319(-)
MLRPSHYLEVTIYISDAITPNPTCIFDYQSAIILSNSDMLSHSVAHWLMVSSSHSIQVIIHISVTIADPICIFVITLHLTNQVTTFNVTNTHKDIDEIYTIIVPFLFSITKPHFSVCISFT